MIEESNFTVNKEMFYSYDDAGNFSSKVMAHGDFGGNSIFLKQMWDTFYERRLKAREQVIAGKKSPVCYHMERTRMDVLTLSVYMGFTPLKVKMHFKPWIYKRLRPATKEKYALIFDISVDELDNINLE